MGTGRLRRDALAIFRAALAAADPGDAVARYLERRNFSRYDKVWVVGAGKAGASMARAAERAGAALMLGRQFVADRRFDLDRPADCRPRHHPLMMR